MCGDRQMDALRGGDYTLLLGVVAIDVCSVIAGLLGGDLGRCVDG